MLTREPNTKYVIAVDQLKFKRIETEAMLRGQKITSSYSYAKPVGIDEYRRIDAALVRAFGSKDSRTIGTPAEFKIVSGGRAAGWPYVFGENR